LSGNHIIVLGVFNPAIFSPHWIRSNEVIEIDDGNEPKVEIIHQQVCQFSVSDIDFSIELERFAIKSEVHDNNILLDIFNKIFAEKLVYTPLRAIGINFFDHIDMGSFERRNKLGRILAPIDPWMPWSKDFESSDPELNGGMSKLSMKKARSGPPCEEYTLATIEPSARPELRKTGIFILANNHFGYKKSHTIANQEEVNKTIVDYANERMPAASDEYRQIQEILTNVV